MGRKGSKCKKVSGMNLGLDLSLTSTGYCVLDSRTVPVVVGTIRTRPTDGSFYVRARIVRQKVMTLIQKYEPEAIAIEGHAIFSGKSSAVQLAELNGIVRYAIFAAGWRWENVPPSTLKKFAAGKGNASKAEMIEAVRKKWGFATKSNDEADAYALAKYAQKGV
jgi:crossover junction endodeoxyribonuclease RuvC